MGFVNAAAIKGSKMSAKRTANILNCMISAKYALTDLELPLYVAKRPHGTRQVPNSNIVGRSANIIKASPEQFVAGNGPLSGHRTDRRDVAEYVT
jgi:hypothetical protein